MANCVIFLSMVLAMIGLFAMVAVLMLAIESYAAPSSCSARSPCPE